MFHRTPRKYFGGSETEDERFRLGGWLTPHHNFSSSGRARGARWSFCQAGLAFHGNLALHPSAALLLFFSQVFYSIKSSQDPQEHLAPGQSLMCPSESHQLLLELLRVILWLTLQRWVSYFLLKQEILIGSNLVSLRSPDNKCPDISVSFPLHTALGTVFHLQHNAS